MVVSELGKRFAVAGVGIPLVLAAVYAGGWWLGSLLAAAAGVGAFELFRMAQVSGHRPFSLAGAVLAGGFVLTATVAPTVAAATPVFWVLALAAGLLLATAAIWARGVDGGPLGAVGTTLFGAVLLGGTLSYGIFLRYLPVPRAQVEAGDWGGTALVMFPLALAWVSDSGAYFGGRAFGRRKLLPAVSPAKTVAGALSGVVVAVAAGAFLGWLLRSWLGIELGMVRGAIGGALISPAAQVGDLAESLLKREAGVKDSGRLFPGHGGLLDRLDSLLFAIPVAFWYLSLVL